MNDCVFVMANSKLAKKKQTRKPIQINIDDCSSNDECVMENVHNEALSLDENLVSIQVEEDEILHKHDLDITYMNGERDGNGVEGLYGDYEFNKITLLLG